MATAKKKSAAKKAAPTPTVHNPEGINWEKVELHYRAGIRSLKDIGAEFGVSDAGIIKRAKRDGWTRDLTARIRQKAEAKVSAAAVRKLVSPQQKVSEEEIVDANADLQTEVRIEHRSDIKRTRELFRSLLAEIEGLTTHGHLAEQLMELLVDGSGDKPSKAEEERVRKMRETLDKILSMAGRVDSAKKLTDMLEKLVAMERVAYGIDDRRGAGGQVGDISISF
jgi:hypothetical protein